MNNDIKEILDDLDYCKNRQRGNILLKYSECDLLLDYITNLQEEKEEVKERYDLVYKKRCQLAIEYIKKHEEYFDKELGLVEMMGAGETRIPVIRTHNLLKILKGEDNE